MKFDLVSLPYYMSTKYLEGLRDIRKSPLTVSCKPGFIMDEYP
jgi:hypothetical protein